MKTLVYILVLLSNLEQAPQYNYVRQPISSHEATFSPSGLAHAYASGIKSEEMPKAEGADTLSPIQSLHASIDSFYTLQTQSQLLEFQTSKKGEWLKFLPNLGITYTIDGQPRPSISISSSIFYQAKKTKQTRFAKRQSIIQANQLAAQKNKAQLAQQILRYELLKEEIEWKKESHQVEREIFLIKQEEFNRLERSPADYLQAKRTYLLQQQSLREKERQLKILEMEILSIAHQI